MARGRLFAAIGSFLIGLTSGASAVQPPAPERDGAQMVTFSTDDNLLIRGEFVRPMASHEKAPIVILVHMYRSDHSTFAPLLPALRAAGFAVLAIDLRGHGQSVGPPELRLAERVAQRDKK